MNAKARLAAFFHRPRLLLGAVAALALTLVLGAAIANAVVPTVSIEDATNVEYTTAAVAGEVDPQGQFTEWRFQYITDAAFEGNIANTLPGFEGASNGPEGGTETAEPVAGALSGLQPTTVYHLRLFASNGDGPSEAVAANTFETKAVTAPAVTVEDADSVTATSAHFAGTVDPGGTDPAFDSSCAFDYVTDAKFQVDAFASAQQIGCDVNPVTGSGAVPVEAEPKKLEPNTTYHLRLRTANLGGSTTATAANTFATATASALVVSSGNTPLGQGQFGLGAYVTPGNSAVSDCHFEYGLTASYGQSAPCASTPPTNNKPNLVTAQLSGLTPGATYHYLLSVTTAAGTAETDDATFRVLDPPGGESCPNADKPGAERLSNCRAWELVSPPDKLGGDISDLMFRTRAAADGSAAQFTSFEAFADARGTGVGTEYLSQRSSDSDPGDNGWSTHAITPAMPSHQVGAIFSGNEPAYVGEFSADLNRGVFASVNPLTSDPATAQAVNLYLRDDLRTPGPGSYSLLTSCPLCAETETELPYPVGKGAYQALLSPLGLAPRIAAASPDFDHVLFESRFNLTSDAPAQPSFCATPEYPLTVACNVRLYESDHGVLRLTGRVPSDPETEISCDDSAGPACVPAQVSVAGRGAGALTSLNRLPGVVSDGSDGHTRVFFTFPTEDGSTADPFPGNGKAGNLYLRLDGTSSTQLNASERAVPGSYAPAEFLDASADGTRAFFLSDQALTDDPSASGGSKIYMYDATKPASAPDNLTLISPDAEPSDGGKVEGMINVSADGHYAYFVARGQLLAGRPIQDYGIYLWHDGTISEIGPISATSVREQFGSGEEWGSQGPLRQSRLTPDGRHLLFSSYVGQGLLSAHGGTDYDHGSCKTEQGSCRELYLYSADRDTLQCVSCDPSGTPGKASAFTTPDFNTGSRTNSHVGHSLSDDGRYSFFSTAQPLLSEDTNGATDAYSYDSLTGQVHLISSGTDQRPSTFMDASADGSDAFIVTRERLVGWDFDGSVDLYDARVDGGFPEPPPVTAPCEGDSCRRSFDPPPGPQPPISPDVNGPGDPKVRRGCPKGTHRVKAKGKTRCARIRRAHPKHNRTPNADRRAGR